MFRSNYKSGYWTQPLGYDGHLNTNNKNTAWKHECRSGTVRTKRIRDLETNEFLSINDVKKLMGFPLDYELYGGVSLQQKQLGNAVCPPIAKEFGECLFSYSDEQATSLKDHCDKRSVENMPEKKCI